MALKIRMAIVFFIICITSFTSILLCLNTNSFTLIWSEINHEMNGNNIMIPEFIQKYLNFSDNFTNMNSQNMECGRIWLYHHHKLILSIDSISNNTIIVNSPLKTKCNASQITIYVTIQGKEYFGGLAVPHPNKCEWKYSFYPTKSGEFTIYARLLYFDGILDANYTRCNAHSDEIIYNETTTRIDANGVYYDNSHILERTSREVKFYVAHEQCCEWCSRVDDCAYYISQSEIFKDDMYNIEQWKNRCILLNHFAIDNMQRISVSKMSEKYKDFDATDWIFGTNKNEKTKYYLGSLAPTTPTQSDNCHKTEYDMIHNSKTRVFITGNDDHKRINHFCNFADSQNFDGRWINDTFGAQLCALNAIFCYLPLIFMPYECVWRYNDTLKALRDVRMLHNIQRITFWGDSIIYNMVEDGICRLLGKESCDCGNVYNESSRYPMLCDASSESISMKEVFGMNYEVPVPHEHDVDTNGRRHLFVTNMGLVHRLWHDSLDKIEHDLEIAAKRYNAHFVEKYGNDESKWPILVIFELPLIISEREYHCTAPRVVRINEFIHRIFEEKYHWNVLPLMKITEAVQYDFTEGDGLHPDGLIRVEIVRILFEFVINSLAA